MSQSETYNYFVGLRKELGDLRAAVRSSGTALTPAQRDIVAIAQAEALCRVAAELNEGIVVFEP